MVVDVTLVLSVDVTLEHLEAVVDSEGEEASVEEVGVVFKTYE
jgi:hypothetical protein